MRMIFNFILSILLLSSFVLGQNILNLREDPQQKPDVSPGQLLKSQPVERNQTGKLTRVLVDNIFFEDFEGSTSNWVRMDDPWEIGSPSTGPKSGYSSTKCAATNLDGAYLPNKYSWLQSKTINLPTLSSSDESIVLKFNEWYEIESSYDYGYVYIRANGGSWVEMSKRTGSSDWIETEIDLTTYAGDQIEILFYFTTNGSNEYSGWYIDNVKVQLLGVEPLTTTITSLDHTKFPFIYLNVNVDTFGTGISSLTKDNFTVIENDVVQTGYFDVTPPESSGGTRLADIIFVLDVSGSMGDEIDAVKANMEDFINSLDEKDVDYRVGFITFADIIYVYNDGELYEGKETILSIIDNIELGEHGIGSGGDTPENQLEAMAKGSVMNFRSGAQRIEIMLTDAYAHSDDAVTSWTVSSLIDQLKATNVNCYPVFDTGNSTQKDQYIPIADATNPDGKYYHIYDNFNEIIDDISSSISNTYVVQYKSSDPVYNGVTRFVEVKVNYKGETSSDFASYVPGAAPRIERTAETVALHDKSWAEGTTFTIEANITDEIEPYLKSATLYYRTTNDDVFENVEMTLVSGTLYRATIPGSAVHSPGVDYYISATDDQSKVTDPSTDPRQNPYQIAILPNYAPKIIHTPVNKLVPGADITITADITDETNNLTATELFYRKTGRLLYQKLNMENIGGDTYRAIIPGSDVTIDGVDYYIKATDDFGVSSYHGDADHPHHIGGGEFAPLISSIKDVPHDQGGKVLITWEASSLDNSYTDNPVLYYSIWRAIPNGKTTKDLSSMLEAKVDKDFSGEAARIKSFGGGELYWEWLANQPAHGLRKYSYAAETLYDSMSTTAGWHYFFVSAHTAREFFDSVPDSGYSVDNLAPSVPLSLMAIYDSKTKKVILTWQPNPETDIKQYNIYRRTRKSSEWQLIGYSTEPLFTDYLPDPASISDYFYSVSAEDIHENKSELSEEASIMTGLEGLDNRVPEKFALYQNFPNPFNPTTTIVYDLPETREVRLEIFTASGQKIKTLFTGQLNQGRHKLVWDGTDDAGNQVASGVYLYQLKAGDFVQTRKMILMR
ncbi:MAG: VWA domain-containing protein [Calditrichaeota bacterium]|nr:VWA domain-containing protein [Calditrichota bacterium]